MNANANDIGKEIRTTAAVSAGGPPIGSILTITKIGVYGVDASDRQLLWYLYESEFEVVEERNEWLEKYELV